MGAVALRVPDHALGEKGGGRRARGFCCVSAGGGGAAVRRKSGQGQAGLAKLRSAIREEEQQPPFPHTETRLGADEVNSRHRVLGVPPGEVVAADHRPNRRVVLAQHLEDLRVVPPDAPAAALGARRLGEQRLVGDDHRALAVHLRLVKGVTEPRELRAGDGAAGGDEPPRGARGGVAREEGRVVALLRVVGVWVHGTEELPRVLLRPGRRGRRSGVGSGFHPSGRARAGGRRKRE